MWCVIENGHIVAWSRYHALAAFKCMMRNAFVAFAVNYVVWRDV